MAALQGVSRWTGERRLLISMVGHGRETLFEDMDLSRTVGWLNTSFPVLVDLEEVSDPAQRLRLVKSQFERVPQNGLGYGLLRYLNPGTEVSEVLRSMPQAQFSFNYWGPNLSEYASFESAGPFSGHRHDHQAPQDHLIVITALIVRDQLQLRWAYSENMHRRATIESLASNTVVELRPLIAR